MTKRKYNNSKSKELINSKKSEGKTMADYETQIVVIARRTVRVNPQPFRQQKNGAEVIVVEKAAAVGGAANMGMGPLGIGTKYQKQNMIDISVEKAFNMFMEYTHYNVDARLVNVILSSLVKQSNGWKIWV